MEAHPTTTDNDSSDCSALVVQSRDRSGFRNGRKGYYGGYGHGRVCGGCGVPIQYFGCGESSH